MGVWRSFSGSINPINLHADIRLHLLELIPSKGQLFARARASRITFCHTAFKTVYVCVCVGLMAWMNQVWYRATCTCTQARKCFTFVTVRVSPAGQEEVGKVSRCSAKVLKSFFSPLLYLCVCVCLCPLRYGNEGSSGSWEWGVSIENMAFWCSDFLVRVRGFVFLCVCSFPFLIVHQYPSRGRRARYQIIKNGPRQSFPLPDRGNTLKARKSCPTLCPLALPRGFSTLLFRAAALGANIPEKAQPVCYGYTVCVCFFLWGFLRIMSKPIPIISPGSLVVAFVTKK